MSVRTQQFRIDHTGRLYDLTEDSITWDVEVKTPGPYRATVYYTLAERNDSVELELRFRENSTQQIVTTAHHSPLVEKERDRIPRQESYVKSFRPLDLGVLRLEAGRGPLLLQAPEIPGRKAIDLRWLEPTLLKQQ